MKGKKLSGITLMLASAAVASAFGGALINNSVIADEETAVNTYALSTIFTASDGATIAEAPASVDGTAVAAFELPDEGSVALKRNLALKWEEANGTQYLTVKFAFKDLNFNTVTFSMDSISAWATKDDKTTNTIEFVKGVDDTLTAYVNPQKDDEGKILSTVKSQTISVPTGVITLTLKATDNDGEFSVALTEENGTENFEILDKFINIGANYAKYSANSYYPFKFKADTTETDATLLIYEINGQRFCGDAITAENEVKDTAPPVLVVNEEFDGFLLGTNFTLDEDDDDYKVIDVVQSSNLTKTLKYYQYNPETTVDPENLEDLYSSLSTSTIFFTTNYTPAGGELTSVYKENNGKEFVSIYMELGDSTYSEEAGSYSKKKYYLVWYATDTGRGEGPTAIPNDPFGYNWIYLNKNEEGPSYNYISTETDKKNSVISGKGEEYSAKISAFRSELEAAAAKIYIGEDLELPSLKWLIGDNNGYRSLKFTISYYTPNSTEGSPTSSTLEFNELVIPTAAEGLYKFRVFATDAADNKMKYWLEVDGETQLTEVTTSNVWDFDEEVIPTFTFRIEDKGLKVQEEASATKRKDTKVKDASYSLSSSYMKVVGATDLKQKYALYKVNLEAYNLAYAANRLEDDQLTSLTYSDIADKVTAAGLASVMDGDYFTYYLNIYAELLIERYAGWADTSDTAKAAQIQKLVESFDTIFEEGDHINDATGDYQKYVWNSSTASFTTATTGQYLLLADFYEQKTPSYRAAAYRLISVESESESIEGETMTFAEWVEKNTASVVLFSISGVMLILIIVLLCIKPSDESLEEVESNAKKDKKEKKNKKSKKAKKE